MTSSVKFILRRNLCEQKIGFSPISIGNETVTLAEEIKKQNTSELISFLKKQELGLSEEAIKILENEDITS
ncbi:hypothetical protein GLOIN_2v1709121 [Rhizophagus clarus]|uniref:Uncharacterized protein n=1 Tax=Rhizophagus clarus TaxID=94130 RepID=A0A8H3LHB9_9GLOM|nr:hypothetical protein GLOIN_2v1709121 [Rhizophagus clarus]